ncbi:MAG: transporter substrate-binding domain-containing protein [Spirochaetaceae bacterium]|jgi:polar amino acid transport system substrate-binding protein|nr:transporter substrate-binding domain-containing protein [Spirochaetaceae bacterium]
MKKIILSYRLFTLMLCFLLYILPVNIFTESVTLGSATWPPFSDPELPDQGIFTERIRKAFLNVNLIMERTERPWSRVLHEVGEETLDGGYPFGKTEERISQFLFSEEIGVASRYIYHNRDFNFSWEIIDQLKGLKIGIVRGAVFGPIHEKLIQIISEDPAYVTIVEVNSDIQNIKMVLLGRIDIFFGEANQIRYLLEKNGLSVAVTNSPTPLMNESPLYVIFPRSDRGERLRDLFNRGLSQLD